MATEKHNLKSKKQKLGFGCFLLCHVAPPTIWMVQWSLEPKNDQTLNLL